MFIDLARLSWFSSLFVAGGESFEVFLDGWVFFCCWASILEILVTGTFNQAGRWSKFILKQKSWFSSLFVAGGEKGFKVFLDGWAFLLLSQSHKNIGDRAFQPSRWTTQVYIKKSWFSSLFVAGGEKRFEIFLDGWTLCCWRRKKIWNIFGWLNSLLLEEKKVLKSFWMVELFLLLSQHLRNIGDRAFQPGCWIIHVYIEKDLNLKFTSSE